jgi:hypothetical protein
VDGNNWIDDLDNMAYQPLGKLLAEETSADIWLIAGTRKDLEKASNRYGLSLVASMVYGRRGLSFPVICLGLDFVPSPDSMPTLLQGVSCLSAQSSDWPAKVVAFAFSPKRERTSDFRLNVHVHPHLGQWFEVGPQDESWSGVMFGVSSEGTITHHGVGPKGQVPERATLEYPTRGIKAQIGSEEFTAWSVQNKLGKEESYYIKVDGHPSKIIFGGHSGEDQAEVLVITLK